MNVKFQAAYLAGFCVGAFAAFQVGAEGLPVTENLKFHADASVGVTTNGSGQVTRWADQSESDLDLTSSNSRPTVYPFTDSVPDDNCFRTSFHCEPPEPEFWQRDMRQNP